MNTKSFILVAAMVAGGLSAGGLVQAQTQTQTTAEVQASSIQNFSGELAKASLTRQGITNPTPAQLASETQAVQDKRASGMGWGQIANSLGLRLGEVVSAANRSAKAQPQRAKDDAAGDDHGKDGRGRDDNGASGRSANSGSSGKSGGGNGGNGGNGGGGGRGK